MPQPTYVLRAATVDDIGEAARVRAGAVTDAIITDEGMRTWLSDLPAQSELQLLAAVPVNGEPMVGWCTAARNVFGADQGFGMLDVSVAPGAQRQGIGHALVHAGLEHLDALGLHTIRAGSPDGPAQRTLAARFGFAEVSRATTSAVDPRAVEPMEVPDGVELRPFGAVQDPGPLFELDLETSRDIPGEEDFDSMTLEQWCARFWHTVFADDEASLACYVDGELAGLTMMRVDRPSRRAQNNLTATRREFRGRGLARLMKTHSLAVAARAGATVAFTVNDDENLPMLAVNRSLGYRPYSRRVEWERARPAPQTPSSASVMNEL